MVATPTADSRAGTARHDADDPPELSWAAMALWRPLPRASAPESWRLGVGGNIGFLSRSLQDVRTKATPTVSRHRILPLKKRSSVKELDSPAAAGVLRHLALHGGLSPL